MEEKIQDQKQIAESIQKLYTNAKKDPVARKTRSYIATRETTLQQFWNSFQVNHQYLIEQVPQDHNYVKQNYYDQVRAIYNEAMEYIQKLGQEDLPLSPKPQETIEPPAKNQDQDIRIQRQMIKIDHLNTAIDDIKKSIDIVQIQMHYEYNLATLADQWRNITTLHEEITLYEKTFQHFYFVNDIYSKTKRKLEDAIILLHTKIHDLTYIPNNQTENIPHISLPKLTIPTFDGNYETWNTFHDIFEKVIHQNTKLSGAEKMQYLKTQLKGEASKIVQHLEASNANYNTAWQLLTNRYENKRLLFTKFLDNIINLPTLLTESASNLKKLHDTTTESLRALENIGLKTDNWGPIIAHIITRKMDIETNKLYEQSLSNPKEIQDLDGLLDFLVKRFQSLEAISEIKRKPEVKQAKPFENFKNKWSVKSYHTSSQHLCGYCNYGHIIHQCPKFLQASPAERLSFVKRSRLCMNCLHNHGNENCYSVRRCFKCGKSHHTLLHSEYNATQKKNSPPRANIQPDKQVKPKCEVAQGQSNTIVTHLGSRTGSQDVLLATAYVKVRTAAGDFELLRALVDPGSQASFITENSAQLLALPRAKIHAEIAGIGTNDAGTCRWKMDVEIRPRFSSHFKTQAELLILPKLTGTLPRTAVSDADAQVWDQYILGDPTYNVPGPIDILIGVDLYKNIIIDGVRKNKNGMVAQRTELGWIISGAIQHKKSSKIEIVSLITNVEQDNLLSKFWEIEEVQSQPSFSQEELQCQEHYSNTHKRNKDGTYTVSIPFKQDPRELGESKRRAVARFLQLERRFESDKSLEKEYKAFMKEYMNLHHMEKVESENLCKEDVYYIPHQAVIREDKDIRVVFDASSKTSNGLSLNDVMHTGPRLQQDLVDILLRWRKHKIALTADIEKMYRQIKISKEDQQYHRIIWRFSKSEPIQELQLTTVTYGTTAAPYLAIKTLQQLAEDEKQKFPTASKITKMDFYVDDLLTGADSKEEAEKIQEELITMLSSGGFNIRKWTTNSANTQNKNDLIPIGYEENDIKKTLGVNWLPSEDMLTYKVKTTSNSKPTKRTILSEIASIFDPLGLLSPVTVKAKLILQDLWKGQYLWDEVLPLELSMKWIKFQENIQAVEKIFIPRWIQHKKNQDIELHGFCDASEKAYGGVIYIKTKGIESSPTVTLLTAKSKVAPIKMKKTLPRLELCAASLLSRLIKRVTDTLDIKNIPIYAWSDSMITLAWIRGGPEKWKNFVSNRVAEIHQHIGKECWHYVKSEENPADLVSRGQEPSKLQRNELWWHGPAWLHSYSTIEIISGQSLSNVTTDEERKKPKLLVAAETVTLKDIDIITKFSSLQKTIRVLAYCNRFIKKCKKEQVVSNILTTQELQDSLEQIIRHIQYSEFSEDIKHLRNNGYVAKKSQLLSLQPFLDDKGLLRMGGRMQHSALTYNEKHPKILPHKGHITELIISEAHIKTLHGGNQLTSAYIRKQYWIIRARTTIRQVINKCVTCIRYKTTSSQQLMGQLPSARVTPSPPFTNTGIDYAGPIQLRMSKGRGNKSYKGYIVIFICLSTKAMHLEAVSDMTTNAFLAAYKRFTSRRGKCSHIYSDNGSTFIGAKRSLQSEFRLAIEETKFSEILAKDMVQWHFIPPASPHFGGLWEAGVKSIKYHIKRVVGDNTLTFEELSTLLCQIEACLNSRPLSTIDDISNEALILTPAHFLIGQALVIPPEPVESIENSAPMDIRSRWKLLQKLKQDFWKAWSTEYLSRLQQRTKWKTSKSNVAAGDIVLIKEDNISATNWPLARIVEVHPGKDGMVRVVTVQTKNRTQLKRPITKICLLPVNDTTQKQEHRPAQRSYGITSTVNKIFMLICIMFSIIHIGQANFTIKKPQPGLYIEHLGYAKINRGIFRLGVNFSMADIEFDETSIKNTLNNMSLLCDNAKKTSYGTHCDELLHHVSEQQQQILWNMNSILNLSNRRVKRGILGNFLTSIFGVNDEVYRDIDQLDKNQQKLIETSNHQAKLMLSTMASLNETEKRIEEKLENFRNKFNEGIEVINDMQKWYKSIDLNKINIQVLATYQMASNYLQEIAEKYEKLLDACFKRGHLFEFLPPAEVVKILKQTTQKLSSNMVILHSPMYKMDMEQDSNFISIYGYFHITETTTYNVVKATPVPRKINNDTFWSIDISTQFLAIDYNHQTYFEIPGYKFENSIPIQDNTYLCSPTVISSIENNPHCVIDEIYNRLDQPSCKVHEIKITNLLWKEMYMSNTWLFITNKPTRAAVICNNIRQDIILDNVGVIQISPECIIETKRNTLHPKTYSFIPVLATYNQNISIQLDPDIDSDQPQINTISPEPVLKSSDKLSALIHEETDLQRQLGQVQWQHVHIPTTIISSFSTIIIIIAFGVMAYYLRKYLLARRSTQRSSPVSVSSFPNPRVSNSTSSEPAKASRLLNQENGSEPTGTTWSSAADDFLLQPLNSVAGNNVHDT